MKELFLGLIVALSLGALSASAQVMDPEGGGSGATGSVTGGGDRGDGGGADGGHGRNG